ncbi:hypothetical protein PG994_010162 [Apiospora phragmitis]|uniref:Myb-like domain-containing protein n=1 Tax=Apiospora phragmitis TaxID=2905665 RepID=A0ABR1TPB9_9PEZI
MSSMLKKKGGLSFKPKAKPSRAVEPPSTSASVSQTPAITEPPSQSQSQASTPAPPSASATAPTASTPRERNRLRAHTAAAVPSATTTKPQEPPATVPAPTPEPTNPFPAPRDQPTEPTDTRLPGKSNASIPPKPAAPAVANKQRDGHVQSAVPVPAPSQPPVTPAVTSRAGLLATPAPDGLVTPAATQPLSTPDHRPGLATPAPDGLITPAATQPQGTTDHTAPPVAAEAAPSSQSAAPRRNLPSPPTLPITETIAATAAPAEDQPAEAGPSTAEPKKKRQYRKRKAPAVEGEELGEPASAAPKPKRQRKKKPAQEEGAENGDGTPAAPKPRRQRKNNAALTENGDAAAPAAEEEGPVGAAAPKSFRRRRREPTPEDAENQQIDHTTTKMADITRDLGIGKKFKHADAILDRQPGQRPSPAEPAGEDGLGGAGAADNCAEGTPAPEAEAPAPMDGGGVEYDIIDGQIVVNQSSLTVNQHAGQDFTNLETVEEDEFTNLTTSASYLRASKTLGTNHWSDEDTERFYHYLKMFGTDFETISHVFPGKSRRHIKLKFNREEKARPKRINAAIMARGAKKVAIDLEDFKAQWQGEEWQEPDNIRADQARVAAEYEEHLEELRQQRRELGLLDEEEQAPAADADAAAAAVEGEDGAVDDGTQGGEEEAAVPAGVPVAAEA